MFAELTRMRVVAVRHLALKSLARRLFGSEPFAKQPYGKIASLSLFFPPNNCSKPDDVSLPVLKLALRHESMASLHLDGLQRFVPSWLKPQNTANVRFLFYGILLGFSFSLTATSFVLYCREKRQRKIASMFKPRPIELRSDEIAQGIAGLIGTPICPAVASRPN